MRSKLIIRIADDMTAILDCWHSGLRRSAVAKLLQLAVYIVNLFLITNGIGFCGVTWGACGRLKGGVTNDPR